jgi:hypothetical protein
MSLRRELINSGHSHRFIVMSDVNGWEVREEEDSRLIKRVHREDWHRVERDTRLFEMTARTLKGNGWIECHQSVATE